MGDFHFERMAAGDPLYLDRIDRNLEVLFKGGCHCGFKCCSLGRSECAIAPSGTIYPCERLVGNDDSGEFRIGHVDTGIDQQRVDVLMRTVERGDDRCLDCRFRQRCVNWCGCANRVTSGEWNLVGEDLCRLQQVELAYVEGAAERLLRARPPSFLARYGAVLPPEPRSSSSRRVLTRMASLFGPPKLWDGARRARAGRSN